MWGGRDEALSRPGSRHGLSSLALAIAAVAKRKPDLEGSRPTLISSQAWAVLGRTWSMAVEKLTLPLGSTFRLASVLRVIEPWS